MDAFGSLLVGLFGALIAWRTAAGALAVKEVGETSAILGWPVWIAQALMVPGFVLLACAGFYMCVRHLRSAVRYRETGANVSGIDVGFVIFGVMLALLVVRVPIGIAMFMVGAGGYVYLTGGNVNALLNSLKNLAYARLSNYDLVVIPLFLLMGQFATHGGLSKALFRFVSAFLGHSQGRRRHGGGRRLRRLRRHLRLVAGHRGDDGPGGAAGAARATATPARSPPARWPPAARSAS